MKKSLQRVSVESNSYSQDYFMLYLLWLLGICIHSSKRSTQEHIFNHIHRSRFQGGAQQRTCWIQLKSLLNLSSDWLTIIFPQISLTLFILSGGAVNNFLEVTCLGSMQFETLQDQPVPVTSFFSLLPACPPVKVNKNE